MPVNVPSHGLTVTLNSCRHTLLNWPVESFGWLTVNVAVCSWLRCTSAEATDGMARAARAAPMRMNFNFFMFCLGLVLREGLPQTAGSCLLAEC